LLFLLHAAVTMLKMAGDAIVTFKWLWRNYWQDCCLMR